MAKKLTMELGDHLNKKLEMVAEVDEVPMTSVIRDALKEYFEDLDMEWYAKQWAELDDGEDESSESEEGEPEDE